MKYSLISLFIVLLFFSCNDDDHNTFDISIPQENISFKPIPGGAMMFYTLPENKDIFGIQVNYTDARGKNVMKVGSYAGDSLLIDGFNEAEKNIIARISLLNRNHNVSNAIEMTFNTKESSTHAFFNNLSILPDWEGFQLLYGNSEKTSGMVHVFYLGTNPLTQKLDTLLLKSFPITQNGDTLHFTLQQQRENNTIIVRTEDYRGYRVKQQIWENVKCYAIDKMNLTINNFIDKDNVCVENEKEKIGAEYLFDGDCKGEKRLNDGQIPNLYSFLAGPEIDKASFIFDLKKEKIPAKVRIYGALNSLGWPKRNTGIYDASTIELFRGELIDKLPCSVTIFGSNTGNEDDWIELGTFEQNEFTDVKYRWSERCTSRDYSYKLPAVLAAADPAFLEITFPSVQLNKYRYLKMKINKLFKYTISGYLVDYNPNKYVVIQELELFVKKD